MKKLFLLLATVLVLAASGCAPQVDVEAEEAAIREVLAGWAEAWNDKDVERVLSSTTEDASLLPPNAPIATGREALRALVTQIVESPGYTLTVEITKVEASRAGDLAYSSGTYEITVDDPEGNPVTERGKWVLVCKKQPDGTWKVVTHIWNSDGPAAAATD